MRFFINRASQDRGPDGFSEEKPCEEAIQGTYTRLDQTQPTWFIEIDSLEQLMDFYKRYGKLVLEKHYATGEPEIIIYDDYIE